MAAAEFPTRPLRASGAHSYGALSALALAMVMTLAPLAARSEERVSVPGKFHPRTISLRGSGGWMDDKSGWPREQVADHALRLECATARGYVESMEFDLDVRASAWRSRTDPVHSTVLAFTVGHRHLVVTDHTGWDLPITPWLDVGVGIGHESFQRGHLPGDPARRFWAGRVGFGCDAWVNPRAGLFVAYDRLWRNPQLLRSGDAVSESSVRLGLAWLVRSGGRER